jgi:hypothetical protein
VWLRCSPNAYVWAIFAAVVLILLVASSGFRKVALGLVALLIATGGIFFLYDQLSQHLSHSRIPASVLAFDGTALRSTGYSGYSLSGRVKNSSANYSLNSIKLVVTMRDCSTPLSTGSSVVVEPDAALIRFPENMSPEQIQSFLRRAFPKAPAWSLAPIVDGGSNNPASHGSRADPEAMTFDPTTSKPADEPRTFDPTTVQSRAGEIMPRFEVTAPDGTAYDVTGPPGATAQEALKRAQAQYSADRGTDGDAAAPASAPASDAVPRGLSWYNSATGKLEPAACVAIGESTEDVYLNIPPSQARDFVQPIYFTGAFAPKGQLVWGYSVSDTTSR